MNQITVKDNPARSRYEVFVDGQLAGFTEYVPSGEVVIMPHTEIHRQFTGQGVGSALVRGALEDLKAKGQRVYPLCSFVVGWLRKHPEHADAG